MKLGPTAAADVFNPGELDEHGECRLIVGAGECITPDKMRAIANAGIEQVTIVLDVFKVLRA